MNLEALLNTSALQYFVALAECGDLNLCKSRRMIRQGKTCLVIDCPNCAIAGTLWRSRKILVRSAFELGVAENLMITVEGEVYRPPLNVQKPEVCATIMSSLIQTHGTQGDLAKRILDSGLSAGIVEIKSNTLLLASPEIEQTSGRDAFYMLTSGKNMDAYWEPQALKDVNQEVLQRGVWEDAQYSAYSWQEEEGGWTRVKRQFLCRRFEAVELFGRICRLSFGVRIVG